jgi:NADPH:quinone reductase-like Zn-dependent oxidoreductase
MKVMRLDDSTPSRALVEEEVAVPTPADGEVLIRVHAAGVTPSELSWYPTTHMKTGEARHRAVPGHEFSGVVAATGSGVTDFSTGDEVYGLNDWFAEGATAEYCVTQPSSIARKPACLTHLEAASVPIGALTAWQGLLDRAKLQGGERVLIHGGAGAVGIFAVQLARRAGAHVITTASSRNAEFLAELGAEKVIDYRSERFEEQAREIDVVFDCVGGETLQRSWDVLKPDGRMVTIAASGEGSADERTKAAFLLVEPNQQQLTEITGLLDSGALKPCVDGVVPLTEASAAYFNNGGKRNGWGKVVVAVVDDHQKP